MINQDLIEDYKNHVGITMLCKKYDMLPSQVRNQISQGVSYERSNHGGFRKGCGRKKMRRRR